MNILAIDTSGVYVSCAVMKDNEIVSERSQKNGLVHSEALMPMVEDCLKGASLQLNEIDLLACVAGPGSFTGVRIGVCCIKGLASALKKPCVGVNTLDCLKENIPFAPVVCPIMDARRNQVYCAVYENGVLIRNYDACPIDELTDFLKGKRTVFLGDGVKPFRAKIEEALGENALFAPPEHCFSRAAAACACALKLEAGTPASLDAIYLRKPQAERERLERENAEGNNK